jgi:uncharacterized protein (TIGR02147 family)
MGNRTAIDVFAYLDYRSFLRDHYIEQKARGRGFSYRAFSRRAGLRSPNYLKLVIDGERNLTEQMSVRFAQACDLEGEESDYFCDLVAFNQATGATESAQRYAKLTGLRRYRQTHKLELAQDAYHSKWYYPAIRELAARSDFSDDPRWIASVLRPKIRPREAKKALEVLIELGLLKRDEDGMVAQSEPIVSSGAETRNVHMVSYHRTMLEQASRSMDLFTGAQRDISSLTLCVSNDGLERLKQRIQRFRRELLELSALEDDPEQVVQMNFQLFPLSARRGEEDT